LVLAFARAPASLLAPLSYTQMIWAVVASVLVFGDTPDGITLLGMAVIALSGVLVAVSGKDRKA
jgi:drug/metabolite transporter (DMT)-like permease